MKPLFVLYLARSLSGKQDRMRSFAFGVLPHLVMMLVPILLLLLEPDFGASAVITMVTLAMLFAGGARFTLLAMLGLAVVPLFLEFGGLDLAAAAVPSALTLFSCFFVLPQLGLLALAVRRLQPLRRALREQA